MPLRMSRLLCSQKPNNVSSSPLSAKSHISYNRYIPPQGCGFNEDPRQDILHGAGPGNTSVAIAAVMSDIYHDPPKKHTATCVFLAVKFGGRSRADKGPQSNATEAHRRQAYLWP